MRRLLAWSAVAVLVLLTAGMIGWRLYGGSWVRVQTPSMGTVAPVGTLLWVEPVAFDDVEVGDLVTFHPPGSTQSYSHLVIAVNADGTLSTQGKISGPDPWRIAPRDVVGRAVMVWPGVGWLLVAAPVLGVGGVAVWQLVRRLRDRDLRVPVAVLGLSIVLAVAVLTYRPLLGAEQLSFTASGATARATYVGTGLLPVRVSTRHGGSVVLGSGEVGGVTATKADESSGDPAQFTVALGPSIGWGWWLVMVAACFAPAAIRTVRLVAERRSTPGGGAVGNSVAAVH